MTNTLYTAEGLQRLAEIVKQSRSGRSYRDFRNLTGVSYTTIKRIEDCMVKEPEISTLTRLAEFTPYSLEELIAIAQSQTEVAPVREYRVAEDVWMMVEMLPNSELGRLIKMAVDKLVNHPDD